MRTPPAAAAAATNVRRRGVGSARSVYERALDIDYQNVNLWLKYAEMEMRHKNIQARRAACCAAAPHA